MISNKEHYVNVSTRKKNGSTVNTPVWFAQDPEKNYFYFYSYKNSGKIKRIRNFPDIKIAICNYRGSLKGGWIRGCAHLIDNSEHILNAFELLQNKYGLRFKLVNFFSWILGRYYQRQIVRFSLSEKIDSI